MLDSMLKTMFLPKVLKLYQNEGNAVGSIPSNANTTPHTNSGNNAGLNAEDNVPAKVLKLGNNAGLNAEDNVPAKGTETVIKNEGNAVGSIPSMLILHPILTVATMLDSMLKTMFLPKVLKLFQNEGMQLAASLPANTTPHTNSGNNAGLNAEDNVPAKVATMLDSMLKTMFLPKVLKLLSRMKAMQLAASLHANTTPHTNSGNNAGLNAEDNVPAKATETVIKNEGNAVGSMPSIANTTPHNKDEDSTVDNIPANLPAILSNSTDKENIILRVQFRDKIETFTFSTNIGTITKTKNPKDAFKKHFDDIFYILCTVLVVVIYLILGKNDQSK
ncbi:hypothetical protein WDU94_011188 [Cyamophila willieti]